MSPDSESTAGEQDGETARPAKSPRPNSDGTYDIDDVFKAPLGSFVLPDNAIVRLDNETVLVVLTRRSNETFDLDAIKMRLREQERELERELTRERKKAEDQRRYDEWLNAGMPPPSDPLHPDPWHLWDWDSMGGS